jgi:regulator of nonsense transcripts 2
MSAPQQSQGRGRGNKGRGFGAGRGEGRRPAQQGVASSADPPEKQSGRGAPKIGKSIRTSEKPTPSNTNKKPKPSKNQPSENRESQLQQEKRQQEEAARKAQKQKEEREKIAQLKLEAQRKQEQQEITHRLQIASDTLQIFKDTLERHAHARNELQSLESARKLFQDNKKLLKTDLKKCTAFVKKIKSGSAWTASLPDVLKDIATLNLSRYVEEVVSAVVESKPKIADIPQVATVTLAMHQRYPEFLPGLLEGLMDDLKDAAPPKTKRLNIRILTDFYLCGLLPDVKPLLKCIAEACGAPKEANSVPYSVQDGGLVVAFCKAAGLEVFGKTPQSVRDAHKVVTEMNRLSPSTSIILPPAELLHQAALLATQIDDIVKEYRCPVDEKIAEVMRIHCHGAYDCLSISLVQTHGKLQKLEKRCEQDRLLSGSLTEAREKGLIDARSLKENLYKSVEAMSDVLNLPVPHLQVDEDDGNPTAGLGVEVWTKSGADGEDLGPFDDEETRSFYCDVPDLLETIPPALLGLTPAQMEKRKEENSRRYGKGEEHIDLDVSEENFVLTSEAELETGEVERMIDDSDGTGDEASENDKDTPHYRLMVLLDQELPDCHGKQQIDDIAERFCTNHGSSKKSRQRLNKTLFMVPRARLDLLPYFSRMTATIDRIWPDVAESLVNDLEQQFHGQTKFKKNQNIDSRFKTARYIGELTKFRVAPPIIFLRCMQRCLEDFTGSNVDVACCLLETCGRFIHRLKHTNAKITSIMETMARLSKAKVSWVYLFMRT